LSPGTKLGPYDIVTAIGAGGMGEIYRAHDARLGRDVAIKVLPASFAADAERLQRFELEAKAAGQLNHPNVLTVFDIGSHAGAPYLVTELLEGETLRERLATGADGAQNQTALSARKALDIGRQIALGLAAAHAAGIVHRDLKPENVFLTTDGRVKILDFGLARMIERESGDNLPTALQVTNPGTVLGTVGYMSPEQVRGKPADARSDLFALGAILFELVGGRRAFARDSSADTMAAILKEDPPDLSGSGVVIPPALDRVMRRCLEKSPDERFQSARDLAFAIEAIDGSAATSTLSGSALALASSSHTRYRSLVPILTAVGVLAAAGAGFVVGRSGSSPPGSAPRVELRQLTFGGANLGMPALSPDGSSFVFVDASAGNADIYLQRVGGENARNLTADSPGADIQPAFSPDGREIAFRSNRRPGGIFVMGATGESVRRITDDGYNPSWSPDGKELAYSTESILFPSGRTPKASLWRVNVATLAKTKVYDGDAVQPSWSPDSKFFVFWGLPGSSGHRAIFTLPVAGGQPTVLIDDTAYNWNPAWSRDGRFIYFLSDREPPMNVWRVPVDINTGAATGPPERVTTGAVNHSWLSQDTTAGLAFAASHTTTTIERRSLTLPAGTLGPPARLMLTARAIGGTSAASPDGRFIAAVVNDQTEDLVAMKTDGTGLVRLMRDASRDRMVSWTADSTTIYFASDRSGQYEIWRVRNDGGGLEQITRRGDPTMFAALAVAPDGRHVAASVLAPTFKLAIMDLTVPIERRDFRLVAEAEGPKTVRPLGWLSDGRLVAATFDGRQSAAVAIFELDGSTPNVIPVPGLEPQALIAGRFVGASGDDGQTSLIDLTTGAIRRVTTPVIDGLLETVVAPDGKAAYTFREQTVTNIWLVKR